jgi:hypothetical protein
VNRYLGKCLIAAAFIALVVLGGREMSHTTPTSQLERIVSGRLPAGAADLTDGERRGLHLLSDAYFGRPDLIGNPRFVWTSPNGVDQLLEWATSNNDPTTTALIRYRSDLMRLRYRLRT